MFAALGRFVTRFRWFVVVAWIAVAVVCALFAPGLKATTDQSSFLPAHYDSIQAQNIQAKQFPSKTQPGAIIVFQRSDGHALSGADLAKATGVLTKLNGELGKTFQSLPPSAVQLQPSKDKMAALGGFGLAKNATGYDTQATKDAKSLRDDAKPLLKGSGLTMLVGGPAAQQLDSQNSMSTTMAIVGGATVLLIIVLLSLIFRSVLITIMPVVIIGIVSVVANGAIGWAAKTFDLKADSSLQEILIVVLFGVGTDYILFFLFRHRERLRQGGDVTSSVIHALERAGEAIASAGGAVIVAFSTLLLSSLGIFKAMGPALAIAVAVTLVAALTLVPAVATILGKALFWPSKGWKKEPTGNRFAAIGNALGRRPAVFAAGSGAVLVVLAVFALGFHASFDFSSSMPKNLESSKATAAIQQHFAAGASEPATVVLQANSGKLTQAEADGFAAKFVGVQGVDSVQPAVDPAVAAKATAAAKAGHPQLLEQLKKHPHLAQLSADGTTAIVNVVLSDDPGSDAAAAAVRGPIRDTAHSAAEAVGATAYVGGTTSVFVDIDAAMKHDYKVVFPVAAGIILIILMLLLRSLVAPWYLLASVGLGFAATLGATVLVIQHIKGDSGLIFMLPIYIYLFVVALGTDYNILMIARLREEAREGRDPRSAAAEAIKHAGPTIAAAGLILAGTFASLMLGGNSLIVSMGFALSFGIFTAAFIMAMFFTPSLTALIGHAAWWPGHGDEKKERELAR
ncbi:MAG: MMPL family transporter [Nocardioidaceae bacterium]|nr:MMPL family transporter [Nocardioidaceae bacterium]MCL2612982.1 MMPL family transporter [Nocardioidaceae bacterium]